MRVHPSVLLAVAFLGSAFLASPNSAPASTYFVKTTGNDADDGRTPATAFKTVLRAAQALDHGDGVVIAPGTYRESVFLAERFGKAAAPIKITGDESGALTAGQPGPVVIEAARPDAPALHFFRFQHLAVSGLTFRGGEGLRLERCRDTAVRRCSFDGCSRGLAAEGTQDLRIESSVVTRCVIGLFMKGAVDTRIAHVSAAGCTSAGLTVLACGPGAVRNCLLVDNNTNLVADDVSAPSWTSDHNVLAGAVGPWGGVGGIHNVYEWHAASGQDRHSVHVAPAFADPQKYDLHLSPTVTWAGGLPGMNIGLTLDEPVTEDRDGRPFRGRRGRVCVGAYDYPDPQPAAGWKRLAASLNGAAGPRQSAGVYREDGSLVRTLLADVTGATELWWDGLDDQGRPAAAGRYEVRAVTHDVRMVDDGNYGDNGNPKGTYNPDNPERIVTLPDGRFVISTPYDEAGMPLRLYAASGQSLFAVNLAEKDFVALAASGDDLIGAVGKEATKLVRLVLPGERAAFPNGAESYPIFAGGEKPTGVGGLAVAGSTAFVSIPAMNLVRAIDLATGTKKADFPLSAPGDLAADEGGGVWAISGTDIVQLDTSGTAARKFPSGLKAPKFLAAGAKRLAAVDREAQRLALIDRESGQALRTFGSEGSAGQWTPTGPGSLRDPRGVAFLPDGQLLLAETGRTRAIDPDTGIARLQILSNFMDVTVVHPARPEYLYSYPGVFRVDPESGAWEWLVESPKIKVGTGETEKTIPLGSPSLAVTLGGRPFVVYHVPASHTLMYDVTDPLKPRLAWRYNPPPDVIGTWAYSTICLNAAGDLVVAPGGNVPHFTVVPFKGLDGDGNPVFDMAAARKVGPDKDPDAVRGMSHVGAVASDRKTADFYYLAVTSRYNKMVPGWGADGTGVGKSTADGTPQWFSLTSGGNCSSISAVHDGKQTWVMGGKSFGGQIDLFDADGLRLTTGNWSWPAHYQIGFIDLRYGVQAYVRPDGKVGAYVEDDMIGRFARARVDGADTVRRTRTPFDWQTPAAAAAAEPPLADRVASAGLARGSTVPKVAGLSLDGDWAAWEKAGVTPQVVVLPGNVTFRRNLPDDLLQTFRQGTAIGAFAHDGQNLYVSFVVTDDTMHFDAETGQTLWMYDGIELWLEEEQFGLGFTKDGTPSLYKFRHHDRAGTEWKANYALAAENVRGQKLPDLSKHPLGRRLDAIIGGGLSGKAGYALTAKIPFDEIKLVGGIAGRGKEILNMTGTPGEVIRVGVTVGAITAHGREQDFKVGWPAGMMFSDPTRSQPFLLGE